MHSCSCMNTDNFMSINCNRINRNQFSDELTMMTASLAATRKIFKFDIYLTNLRNSVIGEKMCFKNCRHQSIYEFELISIA